MYPCNRCVGVPELKTGHLLQPDITDEIAERAGKRHHNVKCSSCEIRDVCKAGCMYHAHAIYGDAFREDYFCDSYIAAYTFILQNLGKILWKTETIPRNRSLEGLVEALAF